MIIRVDVDHPIGVERLLFGEHVAVADGEGVQVCIPSNVGFTPHAPNKKRIKKGNTRANFTPVDFQTLARIVSMLLLNLLTVTQLRTIN